jgi:protein Tex
MIDLVSHLARELSLTPAHVSNALQLHADGGTVPFIARYRKERTGSMTETQLRALFDRHTYLQELEQRKQTVLKAIEEQGKLTDELRAKVDACSTKAALEDLYLPFKPKKRTRATVAREKGLEPLAGRVASLNSPDISEVDLNAEAAPFVQAEKGVTTAEEALAGAADILAEDIAFKPEHRAHLREYYVKEGTFAASVRERFPAGSTKFEMYRDFKVPVKSVQPHNLLALRRGERSGILQVSIAVNEEYVQHYLESNEIFSASEPLRQFYRGLLRDAFERLMRESLTAEVRALKKEQADTVSIKTFEANVRDVLLAPPAGPRPTLGVDPGFRSGCKLAVVDRTGRFVEFQTVYPHDTPEKRQEAAALLRTIVEQHGIELIAIGNGTASRETDQFITEALHDLPKKPVKVIVNEAGASVYSASKLAKEELPELDVTVRGAISIARRLQDPLAELVKIDPKAIGVGQYQHDVDQRMLRRKLEETVQSCVNYVGVDLNTASTELLKFVAGINAGLARSVVAYRNEHGPFASREQLHDIPQLGPKSFEQAAGFLRVRGGSNPLDNTGVHPERYELARTIVSDLGLRFEDVPRNQGRLKEVDLKKYVGEETGEVTIRDILEEIARPGRDPRRQFRYATFKEGISEIKDLTPGLELEGVVTNVTNFGAFVDVGVHHDGLVHVSQLADRYVADPKSVVRVGQIVKVKVLEVNEAQKRISLTMKGFSPPRPKKPSRKPQKRQQQGQQPQQPGQQPQQQGQQPQQQHPHQEKREQKPRQEPRDERTYTLEDLKSKFNNR